jgi:hypothetical protein
MLARRGVTRCPERTAISDSQNESGRAGRDLGPSAASLPSLAWIRLPDFVRAHTSVSRRFDESWRSYQVTISCSTPGTPVRPARCCTPASNSLARMVLPRMVRRVRSHTGGRESGPLTQRAGRQARSGNRPSLQRRHGRVLPGSGRRWSAVPARQVPVDISDPPRSARVAGRWPAHAGAATRPEWPTHHRSTRSFPDQDICDVIEHP